MSNFGDNEDAQGTPKVTEARVVINYLSVNPLIRPLRDIVSFMTCSWSRGEKSLKIVGSPGTTPEIAVNGGQSSSGFQVKLVAHYPRVFFVADESDPHSRALVLRG